MLAWDDLCGDTQSFYVSNSLHVFLCQRGNQLIGDISLEKMADAMRKVKRSAARHVNITMGSDYAIVCNMTNTTDIYHVESILFHKNSRNKPNCQTNCT